MNQNDLCYQSSKHGPEILFGNLRVMSKKIWSNFPARKINFMLIKLETMFKKKNEKNK